MSVDITDEMAEAMWQAFLKAPLSPCEWDSYRHAIAVVAPLIVAAEREECAKEADAISASGLQAANIMRSHGGNFEAAAAGLEIGSYYASAVATAIRARGGVA
jgi:hypothetical protein